MLIEWNIVRPNTFFLVLEHFVGGEAKRVQRRFVEAHDRARWRIEAILATAYTEEPTSDAQHLRLLATVTEADWVQYRLLMSTSVRVPDTTSGRLQTFQDEGFDRTMLYEERQILMRSLWEQIQTALLQLRGTDPIGDGPPLTKSSGSIVGAESPMIARSSIL